MLVRRDTCPQEEPLTVERAFPKMPLSLANVLLTFIILLSALLKPRGLYGDYMHMRSLLTTYNVRLMTRVHLLCVNLQLENLFINYFFK